MNSENIPSFCFVGMMVMLLAAFWVRSLVRAWRLKQLCFDRGWSWLPQGDWQVPIRELLEIPTRELRLENGFKGSTSEVTFFAADCVAGSGKHRSYVTVIAVRSEKNPFGFARFAPGFSIHQGGGWFAVALDYKIWGQRIMPAAEMISIIDNLS